MYSLNWHIVAKLLFAQLRLLPIQLPMNNNDNNEKSQFKIKTIMIRFLHVWVYAITLYVDVC